MGEVKIQKLLNKSYNNNVIMVMSKYVEIKSSWGLDLDHFIAIATEYYGKVGIRREIGISIHFTNSSYAQEFENIIIPYLPSGQYIK